MEQSELLKCWRAEKGRREKTLKREFKAFVGTYLQRKQRKVCKKMRPWTKHGENTKRNLSMAHILQIRTHQTQNLREKSIVHNTQRAQTQKYKHWMRETDLMQVRHRQQDSGGRADSNPGRILQPCSALLCSLLCRAVWGNDSPPDVEKFSLVLNLSCPMADSCCWWKSSHP